MSRTEIAKQVGALSVGATALTLGVSSGATLGAIAGINLAILWRDLESGKAHRIQAEAVQAVLRALEASREFREHDLATAAALLASQPICTDLDEKDEIELLKKGQFASEMTQRMIARLSPDPKTPSISEILRLAFVSAFTAIEGSPAFHKKTTWEIGRTTLEQCYHQSQSLDELHRAFDEFKNNAAGWMREVLENLAHRFGIAAPYDLTDRELQERLKQKAAEYRSLRAHIDGLDDRLLAVVELKRAAQDAADTLDFDAVETILARVDAIETERTAEIKVARARNALLQNDVELAFVLLSAAADGFAGVDSVAPARRRIEYEDLLFQNGKIFGGPGLRRAADMNLDALKSLNQKEQPDLWATAHTNIGVALRNQGERMGDPELLTQAAEHVSQSLQVNTATAKPNDHAKAQSNLSAILWNIGLLTRSVVHLNGSISAAEIALALTSPNHCPDIWMGAQINRANALADLTRLTGDTAFATRAADIYRHLLRDNEFSDTSKRAALLRNNLGNTLLDLAHRTKDHRTAREAITVLEKALKVRTLQHAPVDFAKTSNNLGEAWGILGELTSDLKALDRALMAYADSLRVRTPSSMPRAWAETKCQLAVIRQLQAELLKGCYAVAALEKALSEVEEALTVFSPQDPSSLYEQAKHLRAQLLFLLSA